MLIYVNTTYNNEEIISANSVICKVVSIYNQTLRRKMLNFEMSF